MSAICRMQPDSVARLSPLARMRAIPALIFKWLAAAMRRRRGRKELARLDDHLLRDVGLTRYDIKHSRRKRH
jgi:uncharacterized protein YjiS (DUF1127 family)